MVDSEAATEARDEYALHYRAFRVHAEAHPGRRGLHAYRGRQQGDASPQNSRRLRVSSGLSTDDPYNTDGPSWRICETELQCHLDVVCRHYSDSLSRNREVNLFRTTSPRNWRISCNYWVDAGY
jgi:hypothetical protein